MRLVEGVCAVEREGWPDPRAILRADAGDLSLADPHLVGETRWLSKFRDRSY